MNKKKLATMALIPTLSVVALLGSVYAASSTTASTSGTMASTAPSSHMMRGPRNSTQLSQNLATILGLSATDIKTKLDAGTSLNSIITAAGKTPSDVMAQLETLRQASMKTKLAAEVASGKITQAQADKMVTAMTSHKGMTPHVGKPKDNTNFANDLATILGLNATDVKAKLDAGTKPSDIITSAGKTESDVMTQMKTLMENSMKTRLAAEVASGKITQAQADQMITNMANHTGHMGGPGFHRKTKTSNTQTTSSNQTTTQ